MESTDTVRPRLIRGRRPLEHEKEFLEFTHYESGQADRDAAEMAKDVAEPWLSVVDICQPTARAALHVLLHEPDVRARIQGRVLDLGAGTCWLTAEVSKLPEVSEVFAVDLSERFLLTSGLRVIGQLGGMVDKVTFVASDYNELPIESGSVDCALLFAAIHHSLAPIRTLREAGRCLRKGGVLIVHENPQAVVKIRSARARALSMSSPCTEITYTKEELEYLFLNAGLEIASVRPLDALSRGGWRRLVRLSLRRFGLEHVLLNPPAYVYVLKKR